MKAIKNLLLSLGAIAIISMPMIIATSCTSDDSNTKPPVDPDTKPPVDPDTKPPVDPDKKPLINVVDQTVESGIKYAMPALTLELEDLVKNYQTENQVYNFKATIDVPEYKIWLRNDRQDISTKKLYTIPAISIDMDFDFELIDINASSLKLVGNNPNYIPTYRGDAIGTANTGTSVLTDNLVNSSETSLQLNYQAQLSSSGNVFNLQIGPFTYDQGEKYNIVSNPDEDASQIIISATYSITPVK